ncbi:hypothetical protein ACMGDH_13400 [Sphingomonas sp. DT-207]
MFARLLAPLALKQIKVPVHTALRLWRGPGLHSLKVLLASVEVAGVAGPIPHALLEVPASAAGALQIDVERDPVEEGGEPLAVRHARSEGLQKGSIGMAQSPLLRVQLVGAGLPVVKCEVRIRLWADAPGHAS